MLIIGFDILLKTSKFKAYYIKRLNRETIKTIIKEGVERWK
jgi:hypothetical protein